jgi:hypothetical protein
VLGELPVNRRFSSLESFQDFEIFFSVFFNYVQQLHEVHLQLQTISNQSQRIFEDLATSYNNLNQIPEHFSSHILKIDKKKFLEMNSF